MQQYGVSIEAALRDAVAHYDRWMGGAVIVEYDDGTFDAVPQPHLTDISWSGRGHVRREVLRLTDLAELGEFDRDLTDEDIARLAHGLT